MTTSTATVMDDIAQAGRTGMIHLWIAILAAILSLLVPFVGLVAAYSGYRLSRLMDRRWFGLLFAAFGLASALSWLALVTLG